MYGKDALYGPLRACNHRTDSGLLFKKKDLDVPVYHGINYWKIKHFMAIEPPYKPEKYFYHCITIPGVVLTSNSHTIDIPKNSQITVNYTGVGKAKRKATLTGKDQSPAPDFQFQPEKEDWCYPIPYAARGRMYFNETSEDNDYIETYVDESEMWKDGVTEVPDTDPDFKFPETPDNSDDENSGDEMDEIIH